MSNPEYGQYCGLARALEMVGERWGLLVVRDLLVGPRRFSELQQGLPKISSNVLSSRLKELEAAGVVRRRVLPRPESGFHYELTECGRGLEDAVTALGRWGACMLGEPGCAEVVTADSLSMALRTTFQPGSAGDFEGSFEVRVGEAVVHARVAGGELVVEPGPLADADLVIEAGPDLRAVMAGEIAPTDAVECGAARLFGNAALFDDFARLFRIAPSPAGKGLT